MVEWEEVSDTLHILRIFLGFSLNVKHEQGRWYANAKWLFYNHKLPAKSASEAKVEALKVLLEEIETKQKVLAEIMQEINSVAG